MRKFLYIFLTGFFLILLSAQVHAATVKAAATWKPTAPDGYTLISWVKAKGVATFMKTPSGNGYIDYLTEIYLPYNQVKFAVSSTPRVDWGPGKSPFDSELDVHNWAFPKMVVEAAKANNPNMQFMWNVPYFNTTLLTTDLSLALRSADSSSTYITSGSRPDSDVSQDRRMLIINNAAGTGQISTFDDQIFINTSTGDQAVEGFSPLVTYKGADEGTARLFLGMKPNGKELVIYCSQGASPQEASDALSAAGVPVDSQIQADGGNSATCAYNLPGQYFVEPGRMLPHLMGAFTILYRGKVTTEGVNVRTGPSTKNVIVTKLKKGAPVIVFTEKNGWVKISDLNNEWVLASLIKKI